MQPTDKYTWMSSFFFFQINTSTCLTNRFGIIYDRSTDMWGLGCLIWEVFNGSLSQINSLKSVGKVSASMIKSDLHCDLNYCT